MTNQVLLEGRRVRARSFRKVDASGGSATTNTASTSRSSGRTSLTGFVAPFLAGYWIADCADTQRCRRRFGRFDLQVISNPQQCHQVDGMDTSAFNCPIKKLLQVVKRGPDVQGMASSNQSCEIAKFRRQQLEQFVTLFCSRGRHPIDSKFMRHSTMLTANKLANEFAILHRPLIW